MTSGSFGPVVVRRRLGAELRRLRESANLRLEQVAKELEVSASKISRIETGQMIAKTWDVRNLLSVYGVEEQRQAEVLRWTEESKSATWWQPFSDASPTDLDYYVSLEAEASSISQFCTPVLPGLLQTDDYARTVLADMLGDLEGLTEEEFDGLVDIRLRRREALQRSTNPLTVVTVIDEVALIRPAGDADVMRAQLNHLLTCGPNVEFRVRPFSAPHRRFALSPFAIFVPRLTSLDPTTVNVEAAGHDYFYQDPPDVLQFQAAFQTLWTDSLSEAQSIELINRLVS